MLHPIEHHLPMLTLLQLEIVLDLHVRVSTKHLCQRDIEYNNNILCVLVIFLCHFVELRECVHFTGELGSSYVYLCTPCKLQISIT